MQPRGGFGVKLRQLAQQGFAALTPGPRRELRTQRFVLRRLAEAQPVGQRGNIKSGAARNNGQMAAGINFRCNAARLPHIFRHAVRLRHGHTAH